MDCNGECFGDAVEDDCGVCDGGNADNLGCGCFEPGPSGCDNQCGSTLENDECGVCDGENTCEEESAGGFDFTITWDNGTTAGYVLDFGAGYDGAYQIESATISFNDGSTVDAGPTNPCNRSHGSGEILFDGFMLTSNVWDADCNQFAFDVSSPSGDMNAFMENGGAVDFASGGYYGDWSGGSYSTATLNLGSSDCFVVGPDADCNGECFGDAVEDDCGVCGGDNTTCQELGDINGDGYLDVLDIVIMINMMLDNEYDVNADMNYDGGINVLDVVILVNNILS
jgi:hypothetical protein